MLTGTNLSAAFDTLDHKILINRLRDTFGISGVALDWFASYLSDRAQSVVISGSTSKPCHLKYGVPQGSVLGPKLYTMYTQALGDLIRQHGLDYHMYADDTQLYIFFKRKCGNSRDHAIQRLEACLEDIRAWMDVNFLKLNSEKTEVMCFAPHQSRGLGEVFISVNGNSIAASTSAKSLGVIFDPALSMDNQVKSVVRTCFMQLHRIGRLRRCLNDHAIKTLVHGLITSRLDYCNALYTGLPNYIVQRLQRVQNSAARLIRRTKWSDHITPTLIELHWLPIKSRIDYKILVHTFRAVNGLSPKYIENMVAPYTSSRLLRSTDKRLLTVPRVKTHYGERSFYNAAPKLWNNLPIELWSMASLPAFTKALKTHLFKLSYF